MILGTWFVMNGKIETTSQLVFMYIKMKIYVYFKI